MTVNPKFLNDATLLSESDAAKIVDKALWLEQKPPVLETNVVINITTGHLNHIPMFYSFKDHHSNPYGKVDKARASAEDIRRVLLEAAELIQKKGWVTGLLETNDGCHCAVGAIFSVIGNGELALAASTAVAKFLNIESYSSQDDCNKVADWNDHRAKNAHEVVATLTAASYSLQ